jgi:hypothetical protein
MELVGKVGTLFYDSLSGEKAMKWKEMVMMLL